MKRTLGVIVLICTIMISLALNGSAEMIMNGGSLIIVLGTYSAGILLSNVKLDDFLEEVNKSEPNVKIIGRFRDITKYASISALIISLSINGPNLISSFSNNNSLEVAIQEILATLLYVVIIQFIISIVFYNQTEK